MYTAFESTLLRIEIERLQKEPASPEQRDALRRKNKELRVQADMRDALAAVRSSPIL